MTIIGAVSPQGSDFSEPVTQNTKRFVRCLLGAGQVAGLRPALSRHQLDHQLQRIHRRSGPPGTTKTWARTFCTCRQRLDTILSEEGEADGDRQAHRLRRSAGQTRSSIIEIAKVIRVGFLQQNAFHEDDTYVPLEKQLGMMKVILYLYDQRHETGERRHPRFRSWRRPACLTRSSR